MTVSSFFINYNVIGMLQCVNTLADDPNTLYFTSGTTGLPKMVEHTHASQGLGHIITGR